MLSGKMITLQNSVTSEKSQEHNKLSHIMRSFEVGSLKGFIHEPVVQQVEGTF
jgi:hypothetical protein